MNLNEIISGIKPVNNEARNVARARNDVLIKPIGSLGEIEELSVKLAGITGDAFSSYQKKAIIIMCSDNGVYEEGVSLAPQMITLMQSTMFQKKITGVGVLSQLSNSDMVVVDIGINSSAQSEYFLNRKIRKGTGNVAKEPAMTKEEAFEAINIGFDEVEKLYEKGYNVIGTGEMGIANTTTASLIIMALTGCSVEDATGKGAGLTEELFEMKKQVIRNAYALHKPDVEDTIDVLSKLGGFDIAGLVGVFLGAAYYRLPVVIDGVISASAALVAYKLCETSRQYMIPSHSSEEPGYGVAMKALDMEPYFNLNMRLGEGTGCPFTFFLIDAAESIIKKMATFDEVQMDSSTLVDIREDKASDKAFST